MRPEAYNALVRGLLSRIFVHYTMSIKTFVAWFAAAFFAATPMISAALTVTQPAASTVVAAGDDYATQVLGDPWDMNDAADIDTEESLNVTSQSFGGGVFSGQTTAADANIYPLFEGYLNSINLGRGANFPVDTSHYRYFTVKMKATKPGAATEFSRLVFYQVNGTYGLGVYHALPNNAFVIFSNDMYTQIDGTSPNTWTQFPQVTGLRVDPATPGGAYTTGSQFSIEWIRLTAPATNAQKTSIVWTDSGYGGAYNIAANDTGGTSFALGANISGTTYAADLTFLPPGAYTITVARSDSSASATSAIFRINAPPQITVTVPNASGDLSRDFAATVFGNPWGPIDATDFLPGIGVRNFKNDSYPTGTFYGRPVNNDPGWFFNLGGHTIDTSAYRSLCFKQEVFGSRSVGGGSIARVFWGNSTGALTTSDDIVLDDNQGDTTVNEYCIPDLSTASLEANPNGGAWSGTKSVFRIDPDELTPPNGCNTPDACHDVRLDSVTLSPFAQANPGYTFQWTLADADNASDTLALYLDPDMNPLNGNEILVHSASTPTGSGAYAWPGSTSVNYGTYHVLVVADDGINSVSQYAGGPLIVGARDGIFRNGFDALP